MKRTIILLMVCVSALLRVSNLCAQWQPTNGPFSGEVHSVVISNGEIIVGATQVYKSVDDGATWNVSNNGISGSATRIMCLVKSGSNLVAGTNSGAYYSTDNGNNWSVCAGASTLMVWSMVVKGANVFLSTSGSGIYKSTNNGQSWTACNTGITSPFLDMRCLVVNGTDLYAGSDGYGIFKTTNDGASWSLVNTGLPGSFYSVSAMAADNDTLLAGTYGAGIYRSVNDGGSWSAVNNGVSGTDMIMGMATHGSSVYASTLLGNLYKTTNNTTWSAVSPGNFSVTRYEAFCSNGGDFYIGCWGFGSPEQSYGLFRTTDDGNTWVHKGITDYPVSVLEVSGSNIFAGSYDITGNSARVPLWKTTETDSAWHFNIGGYVGMNTTAIKASGAVMYLFDYSGPGTSQVYRSTNNGNNWTSTGYNVLYDEFNCFVIAGSLIYASNTQYPDVLVSADNGQSWTVIDNGLSSGVLHTYCLVLKGTTLFVGTDNGVYKNAVGQNNWTAVSSGLTNMYIKSLCVCGSDLFAGTQGGGIFKSSNDGASWTSVSTGIPLFSDIACFAVSGSNIFAGTDNGVFQSVNAGGNWNNVNTGLIDTNITCFTISANYLWAGTFAHGVWRRELSQFVAGVPSQPGPISGSTSICQGSTHTYSVSPVSGATSYTWSLPAGWTGSSATNSIVATAGSSGTISVTANNSYGSSTPQTLAVTVTPVNVGVTQSGMQLTANASGASYQWIDCSNNQPIPGETGQSFLATAIGNYAVIVGENGCSDTSACFLADTNCYITITDADLPYDGLSILLSVDTITAVTIGSSGASQSWDYSMLTYQYQKNADYDATSATPYASTFPTSDIYTYGPGVMFASLFGSAPVGTGNNGYVFWKSDPTGYWVVGYRPDGGLFAGVDVQVDPNELLLGVPANYGSVFNNASRWELPMDFVGTDPDTFYVRSVTKQITADACGSITTPYGFYPSVLREHEYLITVDSIYYRSAGITLFSMEFKRDTLNNYHYIANGIGYPVCIVHADVNNTVMDVEYYSGPYIGITEPPAFLSEVKVYPNPTDGRIHITLIKEGNTQQTTEISIVNAFGISVYKTRTPDDHAIIDLSGFAQGLYFVRVVCGNDAMVKKIILQ